MISVVPVEGLGEITAGDDLADLLRASADLRDGDVLVVTSKVVSKAEGRVVTGEKAPAVAAEAARVVARRGPTTIARTRHGLVMAGAGVDASNTPTGTLVLLPLDPDASARALREAIGGAGGPNVAVVVSDTSGRAWRTGQTDIAIGAAGLTVLEDHGGRHDGYGNELTVTAPAVADEVAGAADLATGKLGRCPAAVVRGMGRLVLRPGEHGHGAAALVRPESQDMFGLGSREAVLAALTREDPRGFGGPAPAEDLGTALQSVVPGGQAETTEGAVTLELPAEVTVDPLRTGALEERATSAAFALGWRQDPGPVPGQTTPCTVLRFVPAHP